MAGLCRRGRDVYYWLGVTTDIDYSQTRKGV